MTKVELLRPADLRCEYLTDPIGIDVIKPRLSWICESSQRGQKQTAYRLLVASSRDKLDKNVGDLWDSGKVKSNRSIHNVYAGKPLKSRMRCYWKVRVWDKDDTASKWSMPAMWSMGLMKPDDWTAKWITNPAPKRLSHPWLRRRFDLKEDVKRAVIHVNTPSYYELHINGKKVSPYVLTPGISKIDKRFLINTYDVTSYLAKGTNCIALWMGPGWHQPTGPGWHQPKHGNEHNSPILRTQLDIHTSSGLKVIGTDSSWRVKESCISQIGEWGWDNFGGERYDGREFIEGWDNADLDDSNWLSAAEIRPPKVIHSWQGCESPRLGKPVSPKNIFQIKSGKWVIDFGRPLTGWMNLKMHSLKSGQKIDIYYADLNYNDFEQRMKAAGSDIDGFQHFNQQDTYIAEGKNVESFCSRFNYHSFRYALIDGLTQKPFVDDARAMMIEPDIPVVGQFECSNELFNSIHETTRYTFRTQNPGLALGTGEAREKSGYGDGGVHLSGYLYNFKCDANLSKWTRDWIDNQHENGWLGHTAPEFVDHGGGPPWGGQASALVRRMAFWYGDKRIVEQTYSQLKRYVEYLESKTKENILRVYSPSSRRWQIMFIGDWAAPPEKPISTFNQPRDDPTEWEFMNNCHRVLYWQDLADFAKIIGNNDEYNRCVEHIRKIRPLIHKEFFVPDKGEYVFTNQATLSMALMAEIPPKGLRPKIMQQLEHEIVVTKNGHLSTGMQGTFMMLDLLTKADRNDLIALIMGQTTYPSWGYILNKTKLNTWPELWNGGGSNVILVTATPGAWFFEGLGGILPDPKHPGFKHFTLRPGVVKSVDWVKCQYQSPYGTIVSNWSKKDDVLTMDVTVPVNTTATVYVPGNNITEGGLPAAKVAGVTFLRMEKNKAVFKVQSGNYEFKSVVK
jgi:alpha-L-rhamnosidase